MTRTQIYLPDDLYTNAKLIAQSRGVSISQLMRAGLELVLKSKEKKSVNHWFMTDLMGKGTGKKGVDAAIHHNDIYDA